jgi:hypothetical protein
MCFLPGRAKDLSATLDLDTHTSEIKISRILTVLQLIRNITVCSTLTYVLLRVTSFLLSELCCGILGTGELRSEYMLISSN